MATGGLIALLRADRRMMPRVRQLIRQSAAVVAGEFLAE